jgi:hypothetical protein
MARQKPQPPVPTLAPHDWVPLNDAFVRIKDSVGSRELAARDVYQNMLDGRLKSAARHVASEGTETRAILPATFWQQFTLMDALRHEGVQVRPVKGKVLTGSWYFFVRRTDLDKHYPQAAAGRSDDTVQPPPRRRGPPATHDWFVICGEIASRCINPKTGCVQVPKRENRLAEGVLDWCREQYDREPAVSEMRAAVKQVCAALRSVQK